MNCTSGVLDVPPELAGNKILKEIQREIQNPARVNMAEQLFSEYNRLGQDFFYSSAVKSTVI